MARTPTVKLKKDYKQEKMKNNKWIQTLSMQPNGTINEIRFVEQYGKNRELWDKLFGFIQENDLLELEIGKYPIDGEKCFAIISEYDTKSVDEAKIEAHKKYIDLQYVIAGEENIGLVSTENASVKTPYNDVKDVMFYDSEKVEYHLATNDTFFLFFPGEPHQPGMHANEKSHVKKLVIKIQDVE